MKTTQIRQKILKGVETEEEANCFKSKIGHQKYPFKVAKGDGSGGKGA